jgi:hypothetical protein
MNFYLSAVNDLLRHPDDQPSIGIILCKTKECIAAKYALRDINQAVGISEYRLAESLPEKLQGSNRRRRRCCRHRRYVRERIARAHVVTGGFHRRDDLVGGIRPPDVTKRSR